MLVALIIFFLIIASISIFFIACNQSVPPNERNKQNDVAEFMVEAPNRLRIFNDSMRLIETTNNATTFIGRVSDIEEFLDWATEQVKNGMPLKMEGDIFSARDNIYKLINRNSLRVTLSVFAKWNENERKPGKRFDNATIKAFEAVDGLLSCLKTGDNQSNVQSEMKNVRNLIEEIYADVK